MKETSEATGRCFGSTASLFPPPAPASPAAMPLQRSLDGRRARSSGPGVLRAETCLRTLLSWIGSPAADPLDGAVATVVVELLGSDPTAVHTALRRVARASAPPPVLRERYRLTRRESDVAQLLALGKSNAEIASILSISEHTARHHTERVLTKLGVSSRAAVGASLGELSEAQLAAS
ncbi:MAG: response regulator transcription factor [Gemmatimonadaceae bacterium]